MTAELIARLEAATEGSRECVLWPRKVDKRGRGRIWHNGKLMLAHRWWWEQKRGPIPSGMRLCHHCDNGGCLNLDHMYLGTHADNMRDMRERKRSFGARNPEGCRAAGREGGKRNNWSAGEANGRAKLTAQQVRDIRVCLREGLAKRVLGRLYGVNARTIDRIEKGEIWARIS